MRWLLLLLIVTAGLARAEVRPVTFVTDPDDAEVYLQVSGPKPYFLGRAGRPLPLDLKLLSGRSSVTLIFRRAGWRDETRTVGAFYFNAHDRFPEESQGPVALRPDGSLESRGKQLAYFARRHTLGLALGAILAGGLAVVLGGRLARLRKAARRASFLDAQKASLQNADALSLTVLGGYRLLDCLGRGGMATVYRAVPADSAGEGEPVAIKVLDRELAEVEEFRRRFERETRILCDLQHPNVVRVLDWGEQEGLLYLVMELLEGSTLRGRIPPGGMPVAEALELARQVATGLQAAHDRGVIHRDLKPENVFVTRQGRAKIMDFGVARGQQHTVATVTGQSLGTPNYMPPEQVQEGSARDLDPRSDQYSLGIVLYEMLCGEPPFSDPDPFSVAFMHVGKSPPSLLEKKPDLPPQLWTVIKRMLAKAPEQRYASLEAMVSDLPG